jgi:electron transport complex protein RnfG
MSRKGSTPFQIVGRLTLILVVTVSILTVYSNFMLGYTGAGADLTTRALSRIFHGVAEFVPVVDENDEILYYEAYDEAGALMGFGFIQTGRGMWGDIQVAGGIDIDYRLISVIVLEQGETPGLGTRIVEKKFLNQFKGLDADEVKLEKYGGSVDAITGATVSSKAVTEIIRKEVEKVTEHRGHGGV